MEDLYPEKSLLYLKASQMFRYFSLSILHSEIIYGTSRGLQIYDTVYLPPFSTSTVKSEGWPFSEIFVTKY